MLTITDRAQFGHLLNDLGLTGYAVEVGVHQGEFSRVLLDSWHGSLLYLVDPWMPMADYSRDPINNGDRDTDMETCLEALSAHTGRFSVMRMRSDQAAERFPDNLLDLAYLDPNHEEDHVRKDLRLWYPKVRSGGIFAGHDYLSTWMWPGVNKAVNEFTKEIGITEFHVTGETGGSFWWRKP